MRSLSCPAQSISITAAFDGSAAYGYQTGSLGGASPILVGGSGTGFPFRQFAIRLLTWETSNQLFLDFNRGSENIAQEFFEVVSIDGVLFKPLDAIYTQPTFPTNRAQWVWTGVSSNPLTVGAHAVQIT